MKKPKGFYAEQLAKLKRLAKEGHETSPNVVSKYYSDIRYEEVEEKDLIVKSKVCKRCGDTFYKPAYLTSSQWTSRRYCITFPPCCEKMPDLLQPSEEQSQ